jgi:competence protein ComGA
MAVRCALTGHLVISSLHSSSCVSAIGRMIDLGVDPYQLKDVLRGVSCQRLYETPEGRTGVYEIMDRKEAAYFFQHRKTSGSFRSLKEAVREAVRKGIIDPAQAEADLSG